MQPYLDSIAYGPSGDRRTIAGEVQWIHGTVDVCDYQEGRETAAQTAEPSEITKGPSEGTPSFEAAQIAGHANDARWADFNRRPSCPGIHTLRPATN